MPWSTALQDYDMEIVHIKGKENVVADAVSGQEGSKLTHTD